MLGDLLTAMAAQTEPVVPVNLDAEEYVLSAMMMSGIAIDLVAAVLDPGDFYRESHARIYRAALSLHQLEQPVDGITVSERLQELGQLDEVGGPARIHELVGYAPATANVLHHARIVVREARRRQYIRIGETLARRARESADPDELHAIAAEMLSDTARVEQTPARIASLDEFIATDEERAEAAIGDSRDTLLPAGGLLIIGGEGGASKTTLTLDAIAHIASGTAWLGYEVNRPVRVLIVENEGPRPQFRDKLREKVESWAGKPWRSNVQVWEEPWAQFSFARDTDRRQLREITIRDRIDVVVADPLDSLGVVGAGTPEDTRTFIGWLRECGLHNPKQPLAFWLLHHFNKAGRGSIIDRLSGAWGGHPDAILGVELGDNHTSKLTWGKLRHATPPEKRTIILAWNLDTRGFSVVHADDPEVVEAKVGGARDWILEYVTAHPGTSRTAVETAFADHHGRGGRTLARKAIDGELNGEYPRLAIGSGKSPSGKYLYPASTLNSQLAVDQNGEYGESNRPPTGESATRQFADPPSSRREAADGESANERPDADLDAIFGTPDYDFGGDAA